MIRNENPANLIPTYDLEPDEAEQHYKGAGWATAAIGPHLELLGVLYDHHTPTPTAAAAALLQQHPGAQIAHGKMSTLQFCTTDL